ncbi:MAG: MAPEG family protein [Pseudomonadota bacterium]
MTQLQTFTALSAVWISIAWLPYILDRLLVRGLMPALANYSPDAKPQSAWAQRAIRAHTVAIETFVPFAALSVLAMMLRPEDNYPGILAMTYFIGIFAHYWIYLLGIPVLRTLAFSVASLSTLALGLRVLGVI